MKKYLWLLGSLFLLLTSLTEASRREEVTLFARIKAAGEDVQLIQSGSTAQVRSVLAQKKLEKKLSEMVPGEEALIKGYLLYENVLVEGASTMTPVFIIEEIHPVSLKRLGQMNFQVSEREVEIKALNPGYSPKGIPVTKEVAGSVTLTASVLMLQSLSATGAEPAMKQGLNSGLVFSAGALATGLFIYEQLKGKKIK